METLSLAAAARSHARRAAWISGGETWTYEEAALLAGRIAARLVADGARTGDRIALVAEPSIATLASLFGIAAAGCTVAPLHPRWTARERAAAIAVVRPRFTLDAADSVGLFAAARRGGRGIGSRPALGVPFAILFTSGSSGVPKGVVLPARSIAASAAAAEQIVPHAPRERSLLCMPLAHVGGLSIVTRALLARRTVLLEPRFDPARLITLMRTERVTRLSAVPAMLDALLAADRRRDLARLKLVLVGGGSCAPALLEESAARGIRVRTSYGMTETSAMVTLSAPVSAGIEPAAGRPLPGVELEIHDARGRAVGAGRDGRIVVRGPMRMSGYVDAPPLPPSEWLDSGDLGRLDPSGKLVVFGRAAECIKSGGENVAPAEVERVLESIPGIRRALVFGVPDPRWGEIVAAAIVRDRTRPADEAGIRAVVAEALASFKRPRRLCFVDALPELASGKVDRAVAASRFGARLRSFAA